MKTILFLGHHKCATTWLRRIARAFAERYSMNYYEVIGAYSDPMSFANAEFSVKLHANSTFPWIQNVLETNASSRAVHLVRDFRDALISQYWSWKISHPLNFRGVQAARPVLEKLSEKDGLLYLIQTRQLRCAEHLSNWPSSWSSRILNVKYESLLDDTAAEITRMFTFLLERPVPANWINELVRQTSFKNISGREQGVEDIQSHYRKGAAGDWKNYFDDDLRRVFKEAYGHLLIEWGYEKNYKW